MATQSVATSHDGIERLYGKVADFVTPPEWPAIEALVAEIEALKKSRNAIVLAHNYMTPDIFTLIGDIVGDSLALALAARDVEAAVIVQAGVFFMAETSKILCPDKTVLLPDLRAGCSLAASITGADMRLIRARHPDIPIIAYVNTSADVKAECDITCTSSNAVAIAEYIAAQWGSRRAIMVPDRYLAANVAANTDLEITTWSGTCEVHERFNAKDVKSIRAAWPGITVLAHPECPPDVLAEADFAGSTAAMSNEIARVRPARAVLLTECSMSDNVAAANPGTDFIRPCNLCPHMKRITLTGIRDCLLKGEYAIELDEQTRLAAKKSVDAMLNAPLPDRTTSYKIGLCAPKSPVCI